MEMLCLPCGGLGHWLWRWPGVTEEDHHGIASFRVGGKIFATVPDVDHIRVMVDEDEIRAAVAEKSRCVPRV
jgi:hypothetical protein